MAKVYVVPRFEDIKSSYVYILDCILRSDLILNGEPSRFERTRGYEGSQERASREQKQA